MMKIVKVAVFTYVVGRNMPHFSKDLPGKLLLDNIELSTTYLFGKQSELFLIQGGLFSNAGNLRTTVYLTM